MRSRGDCKHLPCTHVPHLCPTNKFWIRQPPKVSLLISAVLTGTDMAALSFSSLSHCNSSCSGRFLALGA